MLGEEAKEAGSGTTGPLATDAPAPSPPADASSSDSSSSNGEGPTTTSTATSGATLEGQGPGTNIWTAPVEATTPTATWPRSAVATPLSFLFLGFYRASERQGMVVPFTGRTAAYPVVQENASLS